MPEARRCQEMTGVSGERLSELIGTIYDASLDPERWHNVVRGISDFMQSPTVALGITDLKSRALGRVFDVGWPPGFFHTYEELGHLNPVMFEAKLRPTGDVIALSDVVDEATFLKSRFYRECLKPYGQRDGIGMVGLRNGRRIAFVAVTRTEDCPRFQVSDVKALGLVAPHITRALKISDALELSTLRSATLEATLGKLAAGVVLLDRDGRVVYMNEAAEVCMNCGRGIRLTGNRMVPGCPVAAKEFAGVLARIGESEAGENAGNATLALPNGKGGGLVASVLRIDRGGRKFVLAPFAAVVAVFIQDMKKATPVPCEAFAKLYGLTRAEIRVAAAMVPGLGIRETAELLSLGEATVKSHLQHVFLKTGTSRQSELVQLLRAATPPVRGGKLSVA